MAEYDLGVMFGESWETADEPSSGSGGESAHDWGDLEFPGYQLVDDAKVMLEPVLLQDLPRGRQGGA